MLLLVSIHDPTVGEHEGCADQVIAGQPVTAADEAEPTAKVVDLMAALKASVAAAKKEAKAEPAAKKKTAARKKTAAKKPAAKKPSAKKPAARKKAVGE